MNIFLKNKLYRLFTISSAFGNAGRTLFDIAFIIYATSLPNPELAVSIVSIATTLPYIISFILGYFAGISNPKLDALILQSVPEEKQTSIYSIFSTIITISVPIGTTVILFFANAISSSFALYSLLLLLIIVLMYSFKVKE